MDTKNRIVDELEVAVEQIYRKDQAKRGLQKECIDQVFYEKFNEAVTNLAGIMDRMLIRQEERTKGKSKYIVGYTAEYFKQIEIEAHDLEEAEEMAKEKLKKDFASNIRIEYVENDQGVRLVEK